MTLYQFRLLDEMEQTEALWDAVHLMDRTEGEFQYELYQRDGFYIELKRHLEHGVLHGMRPFKSTAPLDAYLDMDSSHKSLSAVKPAQGDDILLEEFLASRNRLRRLHRIGYALIILLMLLATAVVYSIYRLNVLQT